MRSFFGIDCSSFTGPYYVLHPAVQVYAIRRSRSHKAPIIGYALTIKVTVKGAESPIVYVPTINGTLHEFEARETLRLIGLWESGFAETFRYVVPRWQYSRNSIVDNLVNREPFETV